MKIDYQELFPEELSDECAYHLIQFFYNFALFFEGMHLGQALRHEKAIIHASNPFADWDENEEEEEEEDDEYEPPF